MTTPRSNIVKLRLTDLEKQDWQEAAGGARQLSAWVRSICNAACENLRMDGTNLVNNSIALVADEARGESGKAPAGREEPSALPAPNEKPKIVADAIQESTRPDGVWRVAPDNKREQCPRWMHHRPGVYCGSCKQVVKK